MRATRFVVGMTWGACACALLACSRAPRDAPDAARLADPAAPPAPPTPPAPDAPPASSAASALDPRAARVCDATQNVPERRRVACGARGSAGPAVARLAAARCAHALTAALASGAATLTDDDAARCVAAVERATAGCEWLARGPLAPPAECASALRCAGLGGDAGACVAR